MKIRTYPVGALEANCYFLTQGNECVIVDPGDDAGFLLEEISIKNLTVKAIIATHGHFDHVMGAGEIQKALDVPFLMNIKDKFLITRLEDTAEYFLGYRPTILKPHTITDISQSILRDTGFPLTLIETPGHTPGSICLYCASDSFVLTGDTVFRDGVGRYDFSYSDKQHLFESIRLRIMTLPEGTKLLPGHGDPASVKDIAKVISSYTF